MIKSWWLICNSKEMSHPNPLGNAVRVGDGKTDFLEALADWLEKWYDDCPAFTLTSKTSYALVLTLRAQSGLIKELLSEGYDFIMTSRLQSVAVGCFNECMNVSLSMGVYLCLCLLNKAFGHH